MATRHLAKFGGGVNQSLHFTLQWTLDYPDPEVNARAYNDLRMRVIAVDKKIIDIHGC